MLSAEYLKDPPEKEKILVEHSTKHTVVLKPGFYNRRNQSELLRKSFPAGFQVKSAVTDRLADASVRDTRFINPYGSFTDWTKGETDTLADSVSADLTDPYADVAGPYLTDILASRPAVQKTQLDVNKHSSVVATEVPLHNRSKKASKTKPKVRHSQLFWLYSSLPYNKICRCPMCRQILLPSLTCTTLQRCCQPSHLPWHRAKS